MSFPSPIQQKSTGPAQQQQIPALSPQAPVPGNMDPIVMQDGGVTKGHAISQQPSPFGEKLIPISYLPTSREYDLDSRLSEAQVLKQATKEKMANWSVFLESNRIIVFFERIRSVVSKFFS